MKDLLGPFLLSMLWLCGPATGQSALPGIAQWQRHMQQHAVAEGRSETKSEQERQRGLWQDQIDRVRDKEQSLGARLVKPSVFENKWEPQLDQNEINNILTERIGTKSGLKEIIKHLIKNKIEESKTESDEQLIQSVRKSSTQKHFNVFDASKNDPSDYKQPISFLDKLSAIYMPTKEAPESLDLYTDYEEKVDEAYEKELESFFGADYQESDYLIESDRSSLIGIFDDEKEYEEGLRSLFGSDYQDLDSPVESEGSSLVRVFDDPVKEDTKAQTVLEDEALYTTEEDIAKNFLAEEIISAQSETKELVDEMEKMLAVLEADASSDSALVKKTLQVIKSKLRSGSIQDLLGDTDFKNSVFYRFAIMKLPLREEDIPVAELSEVKKVIRNNIVAAAEETRELLKELKRDITAKNSTSEDERAKRLDNARRQLQKLLEIVSPSVRR